VRRHVIQEGTVMCNHHARTEKLQGFAANMRLAKSSGVQTCAQQRGSHVLQARRTGKESSVMQPTCAQPRAVSCKHAHPENSSDVTMHGRERMCGSSECHPECVLGVPQTLECTALTAQSCRSPACRPVLQLPLRLPCPARQLPMRVCAVYAGLTSYVLHAALSCRTNILVV
jgi:hypothetical protein